MRIIPVQPQPTDRCDNGHLDAATPAGGDVASRRTFGRGFPSRRTFGRRFPSRRTFGRGFPSRRTFGTRF